MDISVVVVEYQDPASLARAITSLGERTVGLTTEIIVVSNSSYPPAKQEEIRASLPGVHFIFNQENLGFARGVNQGLARARGRFILLLNPDARLLDDNLTQVVQFLEANPRAAVVGPLIVDSAGQIQDSCRQFLTPRELLWRTLKRIMRVGNMPVLEEKDYQQGHRVDWVCGACLLARKAAIDKIGRLDERFFMYLEDMDWCRRFWEGGWEVWFQPFCKVEHNAGRGSTSRFGLANRLMWIHLASLCKYFSKWAVRSGTENFLRKPLS
jgi:N-acetylglucosaminyl-diphospho-decaprenol L-rhamnosyltransferase